MTVFPRTKNKFDLSNAPRSGVTFVEVLTSIMLMTAVITTTTSLGFRVHHLWRDTAYQRVASNELANHLDHLTRLTRKDAEAALQTLEVSPLAKQTLHETELEKTLVEDELGVRIRLRLSWHQRNHRTGIELSGWLVDPQTETDPTKPPQADPAVTGDKQP